MFNPFKNFGDIQRLQRMQKELQKEEVVVEKNGVRVVVQGDQQIKEITVDDILEPRITEAINEAVKKTQELAAKKLIEMSREQE
ncbi:hypothetical protein A3G67_03390 [Candidatus Roizmanbacteria bacterium RIFCSPLOWO2_12_FULL_40_12]|uniref:Nucleoid-associated protein, YbaB/EbfC family n=1 Tax=Candidatus Roizmanbacteria bacterium RIFCSPLOWO2_01_FULL_40_42 TaxID=1802066 RepID=A0A1F7J5I5_9BACT|nr:MAG: hypothetical protein A2779_03025 [Candidatus Roizmanbacteria bacterium RIFCSPHIGHO2_01_FULL_40_98]OGK28314.1 MAG: hypothetical protein A3C31_00390 [Candidatus Roizmanbacteria bacterium RIFCSPHIGHO2_02_FULL_40_53]OGK30550.1 MAG: hypothetical protein A2W49_03075 [Candidatus Roizmanbacteria bacterium RIFCSPHIGHO2_12_41_18]OGK36964.1 MAG: hypothetical protein A3E69_00650 [Candidatus Roizmanbacteria bacterium RIFCSPHIGHO2_12_FULL_40_130]OGK50870.1 MAG: hypothetical protein A3B50_01160 [Candi